MAYEREASIDIFGEFKDFDTMMALAGAMVDYVQASHGEGTFESESDAVRYIVEMIEGGHSIYALREQTNGELVNLTTLCRDLGLSYELRLEGDDHGSIEQRTWSPESGGEKRPTVNEDFLAYLTLDKIERFLDQGPDVLRAKVAEIRRDMLQGVPRKMTAPADVLAEARGFLAEAAPAL